MQVDEYLRTSAPHIFAAGDVTGRLMLVPQAIQDGFVAATNAVRGPMMTLGDPVSPIGSFTDPEYAQVGLTEAKARETHDVVTAVVRFDSTTRTIIDGRTLGFCKLIVDRDDVIRSWAATSSASGPSRSPRWRRSPSLRGCGWTNWHVFRSRFRPTRAFWLAWRPAPRASSILKASWQASMRREGSVLMSETNRTRKQP